MVSVQGHIDAIEDRTTENNPENQEKQGYGFTRVFGHNCCVNGLGLLSVNNLGWWGGGRRHVYDMDRILHGHITLSIRVFSLAVFFGVVGGHFRSVVSFRKQNGWMTKGSSRRRRPSAKKFKVVLGGYKSRTTARAIFRFIINC